MFGIIAGGYGICCMRFNVLVRVVFLYVRNRLGDCRAHPQEDVQVCDAMFRLMMQMARIFMPDSRLRLAIPVLPAGPAQSILRRWFAQKKPKVIALPFFHVGR